MFIRKKDYIALVKRIEVLEEKVKVLDKEMLASVETAVKNEIDKTDNIRAIDILDEYLNGVKK